MQHHKTSAALTEVHKPSFTIIFDLRDVLFLYHPQHRGTPQQFTVIKETAALLHQLAAQITAIGKPRHQLYVLSNATQESYHNFISHHPTIFSYFQGIVVSAISGFQKPDEQAYLYIMHKYNLTPDNCVFIDDKYENVAAARAVGMHGIVYQNPEQLKSDLKTFNIL